MEISTGTNSLQGAVAHRTISSWYDMPLILSRRLRHTSSEEPCEPRKYRLLHMPVNVTKCFEGVSYRYIALTERDVEERVVFYPQVWYRFLEREAGQVHAVKEHGACEGESSNYIFGEGYETIRATQRADNEVGVVGQAYMTLRVRCLSMREYSLSIQSGCVEGLSL